MMSNIKIRKEYPKYEAEIEVTVSDSYFKRGLSDDELAILMRLDIEIVRDLKQEYEKKRGGG